MGQIRISAKFLGTLTLPDFCPRCFWIQMHCKELPYQISPGIFNSIDSYSKKVTNLYFSERGKIPKWFAEFGDLGKPINAGRLEYFHSQTNILLTGTPDAVFRQPDGSYFIADYKTAKYTGTQDKLFPIYETQLNSYAFLAENGGYSPVTGLGLVYYEPITDISIKNLDNILQHNGFLMPFSAKLLPVKLNTERIPLLLRKVREIYEQERPPQRRPDCENCQRLDTLISLAHL